MIGLYHRIPFFLFLLSLAFVGVSVTSIGRANAEDQAPSVQPNDKTTQDAKSAQAQDRQPPTFFLAKVLAGEDHAEGLAPLEMEQAWQQQTLSSAPLLVKADVVERYKPEDNEGRKCARVKGSIGQEQVPLKGKKWQDCQQDKTACKPYWVITELDVCDDGLPPTANYTKYKDEAAKKDWKPTVKELKD